MLWRRIRATARWPSSNPDRPALPPAFGPSEPRFAKLGTLAGAAKPRGCGAPRRFALGGVGGGCNSASCNASGCSAAMGAAAHVAAWPPAVAPVATAPLLAVPHASAPPIAAPLRMMPCHCSRCWVP